MRKLAEPYRILGTSFKENIGDSFGFMREMTSAVGLAVVIEISEAWS
jgi:hypothetical protein